MPQINLSSIKTNAAANGEGLLTDDQWKQGFQNATAGMKGTQEGQREQAAVQDKANTARLEGYKAILADPQNAQAVAQIHGIEYTPTLQKMVQQPAMLKNIVMATEFATKQGVKNPEAMQKLMMSAAEQAQQGKPFNPVEVFGSIQGMDTQEPMNEFQRGQLGVMQTNAASTRMNAERYADGGGGGKAIDPWNDARVPPALRIEGRMLAEKLKQPQYDGGQALQQEIMAYTQKVTPYIGDGQGGQGTAPAMATPPGGAPATSGMPPQQPRYEQLWGD